MKQHLASIDHVAVLARYGITASMALPTVVTCPLCKRSGLTVYADNNRRQPWFTCSSCRHHSDALGLVARVESLTLTAAALALRGAKAIDARGAGALRLTIQQSWRYRRIQDLWDTGTEPPDDLMTSEVNPRGGCDVRHAWASLRLSELIRQIIPATVPEPLAKLARKIGGLKKRPRLVSPLEDQPYRVAGLYELRDTVDPCRPCITDQSLLLGLGSALVVAANTTIIALPDVEDALVRQLRGRMVLKRHPPVVGIFIREVPNEYLRPLRDRLVLSAPRATAALLREAAASDIPVHCGQSPRALTDMAWADQIRRHARPWDAHARDYILRNSAAAALAFLRELRLQQDQLDALMRSLPAPKRAALQPYFNGEQTTVQYGRWHIRCTAGQLYNGGLQDLAANVVLRISQIAEERGRDVYRGTIELPSGRRTRFAAQADKLQRDAYSWLLHFMWRHALGVPFVAAEFRAHLLPIAMLLGNATPAQPTQPVGWYPSDRRLVLGRYWLDTGGAVTTIRRAGQTPGDIQRPAAVTAAAATALQAMPEWPAIFDLVAYVASVGLRGLLGVGTRAPLVVCGAGAKHLAALAHDGLGCCVTGAFPQELQKLAPHAWPVVLYVSPRRASPALPPHPYVTSNIITFLRSSTRLQYLLDHPDAVCVTYDAPTAMPSKLVAYASDLLPAFFQHLAETDWGGLALRAGGDTPLIRARAALWRWCQTALHFNATEMPQNAPSGTAQIRYVLQQLFGPIQQGLHVTNKPADVAVARIIQLLQHRYQHTFSTEQLLAYAQPTDLITVLDADTWRLSADLWKRPTTNQHDPVLEEFT